MTLNELKEKLTHNGFNIKNEERIKNNTGLKIQLTNGAIVNFYDNGNIYVQGKQQSEVKKALGIQEKFVTSTNQVAQKNSPNKKIFVVYGHDQTARNQLEVMLRRWELEPLILDQLPSEGQTIIEKLEKYTNEVQFAVVLATPDDEGHRANHPDEKAYRVRQNVVLELGMLLSRLGRQKVVILLKEPETMERPSDIQGLIYIPFKDDLQKDAGQMLAKEMTPHGFNIQIRNL